MGSCCTTDTLQNKDINMQKGYQGSTNDARFKHLFDEREVLGLRGADKIYLIVKVQAAVRGIIARRKVKRIYGFETTFGGRRLDDMNGGVANYDNPVVIEIKQKLGAFNYNPAPPPVRYQRQRKGLIVLENGAKYEGEWNLNTN